MILLGMTGPIGHGKTTFADALAEIEPTTIHMETSMIVAEVANAMHAALRDIPDPYDIEALNNWLRSLPAILLETVHAHTNFEQIKLVQSAIEQHPIEYQKLILHVEGLHRQPQLIKQDITRENKESYRPFLQWLGGYLVEKVDKGIWWNEMIRRVHVAQQKGCQLFIAGAIRYPTDAAILRQAGGRVIKVYRPGHLQNDMLDPTEREREDVEADSTIMSNGTIDDVKNCAIQFLEDVRTDQLKSTYQTKDF